MLCYGIFFKIAYAGVAELADAPDLGSGGRPCRFKSCHPQESPYMGGRKDSLAKAEEFFGAEVALL